VTTKRYNTQKSLIPEAKKNLPEASDSSFREKESRDQGYCKDHGLSCLSQNTERQPEQEQQCRLQIYKGFKIQKICQNREGKATKPTSSRKKYRLHRTKKIKLLQVFLVNAELPI
jgi:hypothetical protein